MIFVDEDDSTTRSSSIASASDGYDSRAHAFVRHISTRWCARAE